VYQADLNAPELLDNHTESNGTTVDRICRRQNSLVQVPLSWQYTHEQTICATSQTLQ